ncbi:MAG: cation diffusion facilitator family transporter [Clostridiales bacterium]|jgi:cation diffusion facilitator family transporter|nr:cation diffusion facilitator family transporter [Clostridiales bacterium]
MGKTKEALRVSALGIAANTALSLLKLLAGVFAGSAAMVSDAVHSMSDVASSVIAMAGEKTSSRQDANHSYGLERMESAAAVALSGVLFFVGAGIGYAGLEQLMPGRGELEAPGVLAAIAAIVSIGAKEALCWYTMAKAAKYNSTGLMAEAKHHRTDAWSSIGSLAGILGARMGVPLLDPVASVVISIFVVKDAIEIFMKSISQVTDKACEPETEEAMRAVALSVAGVMSVDLLKTRLFGDKIYVDMEIGAQGSMPLRQIHAIAESARACVVKAFPDVKHCMVHVNPVSEIELEE